MRIHNLEIFNLASLKGFHLIDFDELLTENKLFAITGDTGSGKSTILNAISLALYGQNYKSSINQTDYVTLGESNSRISITFSIGHIKYLAKWSCRLKKNTGEDLKTPKTLRELFKLTDSGPIPLEFLPEKIINLSFDQFSKTIILNQGQFSQFLTSSFSERKDIIEKLYQGELLEKLSPSLRSEINELKHALEIKESTISGICDNLNLSISELEKLVADKSLNHNETYNFLNLLNELYLNLNENTDIKSNIDLNDERIKQISIQLEHNYAKTNDLKSKLDSLVNDLISKKENFKNDLPILQKCLNEYNQLNFQSEQISRSKLKSSEINDQINKNFSKHLLIKNEISNDHKFLSELSSKIQHKISKENIDIIKNHIFVIRKDIDESTNIRKQIDSLSNTLVEFEADGKKMSLQVEELEKLKNQLKIELDNQNLKSTLDEQRIIQKQLIHLEQIESSRIKFINKFNSNFSKNNELTSKIKQLQENLKDHENQKILIDNSIQLHKLESAILLCQEESIKENQCVVCNSKEIKFIKEVINSNNHNNIDELNQKSQLIDKYITDINKQVITIDLEINNIKVENDNIITSFQDMLLGYNNEFDQNLINDLNKDLNNHKLMVMELNLNLENRISIFKNKEAEFNHLDLKIKSLHDIISNLREKYLKIKIQISELNQQEFSKNKLINEILDKINKIYNQTFGLNDIELIELEIETYLEIISLEKLVSHKMVSEADLATLISSLKNRFTELTEEIETIEKKIRESKAYLKLHTGDQNPQIIIELKQQEIDELSLTIENLKNEHKTFEVQRAELESKMAMSKEQISQAQIIQNNIWNNICRLATMIYEKIKSSNQLRTLNLNFEIYQNLLKSNFSIDPNVFKYIVNNTRNDLDLVKTSFEHIKEDLMTFKVKLNDRISIDEKIAIIQSEIKQIASKKERKDALYQLIGKDEFRNYVLSLIEKDLIQYTNKELHLLCDGRYELVHYQKNKAAPDFYIIDKLKEGLTRKISTLSGGETFMVSLAMALALAEMTRGHNEIDSFFIDEGFGTLDEDSLEDILEMLNSLNTRGKQIGIISHVKSLTERISINIKLTKNGLGASKINFTWN